MSTHGRVDGAWAQEAELKQLELDRLALLSKAERERLRAVQASGGMRSGARAAHARMRRCAARVRARAEEPSFPHDVQQSNAIVRARWGDGSVMGPTGATGPAR